MKKLAKTPLALTLGTTLLSGLAVSMAQAESISAPFGGMFAMTELTQGYMQLAEADSAQVGQVKKNEGSCGEGKCGAKKDMSEMKTKEGSCGAKKAADESKIKEASCGANKAKAEVK